MEIFLQCLQKGGIREPVTVCRNCGVQLTVGHGLVDCPPYAKACRICHLYGAISDFDWSKVRHVNLIDKVVTFLEF
jgi:hypothetical protein